MSLLRRLILFSVAVASLFTVAAYAQEAEIYRYDALGRLTGSTISDGSNDMRITGICFDATGNRMRYDMAISAPAVCPKLAPTPSA